MTETKPNYEINSERDLISNTKKHLQIAWWVLSIAFAVFALIGFIIIAVAFQPLIDALKAVGESASELQGYLALIFFVLLFGTALLIYLLYILKGYLQVKLGYCNDVTYIRENCKLSVMIKEQSDIDKREANTCDEDFGKDNQIYVSVFTGKDIKSENNYNEIESIVSIAQTGPVYYLWSKKYLAYVAGVVTDENGAENITYSKTMSNSKAFLNKADALEYLNEKLYSKFSDSTIQ
ncbi:MAG: hypothetical protein HDT36_04305 [Clostridiales bacterium]|nr:hypothetical protein [Clostridiales bacterium]